MKKYKILGIILIGITVCCEVALCSSNSVASKVNSFNSDALAIAHAAGALALIVGAGLWGAGIVDYGKFIVKGSIFGQIILYLAPSLSKLLLGS